MDANLKEQFVKLKDVVAGYSALVLACASLAGVVLVVLYLILRFRRETRRKVEQAPDMGINVKDLLPQGPPPAGPALSFYNVPVRLAALVLAPAGRAQELPPVNQLEGIIDSLVPGLARVVTAHKPVVRTWPAQLSTSGFAHLLFTHARLPGEGGKGTPWCAVAGTFKVGKTRIMAGMVMRTAAPTNLGQVALRQETQWLDVLRVN